MITVYKHIEEELVSDCTVSDATKGSWVNLVNPDPDELSLINILTEIPTDVLKTFSLTGLRSTGISSKKCLPCYLVSVSIKSGVSPDI